MKTKIPHLILASLLGTTITSYAATFTWDGGGADGNWSTANNWVGDSAPVEADGWHTFVFDTSNQLNSNLDITPGNNGFNVNDLTFASGAGAFTLSGSSIDMLGAASSGAVDGIADITNNSANTQTINNNLIHHTGFNTGLTFNNTNGGAIVVDGVISQLNNQADDVTIQGNGTVTFNGANTYTQDTTISAGTLEIGGAGQLGSGSYAGTITNDGILNYNSSATQTLTGVISGSGSLVLNGSGQLNLSTNNGFTGGVTVNNGTLSLENGGIGANGPLTVNGGLVSVSIHDSFDNLIVSELSGSGGLIDVSRRRLTVDQATDTTYAGIIQDVNGIISSGNGTAFTKSGIGTLTLSGDNTYSKNTTVSGGILEVSGGLYSDGTVSANGVITSTIAISAGTLDVTGSGSIGSGAAFDGTITNSGTFNYNSTTDQELSGIISGAGALTKDNTSTLTLTGANTYTGATTISAGTLEIGGAGQLGSGSYAGTIANDGILNYNSSATQTLTGVISGSGSLVLNGTGQLNLSTNNGFTGGVTVNNGTLSLENGGIGANGPLTVNGGLVSVSIHDSYDDLFVSELSGSGGLIDVSRRRLTVNQATDTTYAGIIQDVNGIISSGNGTAFTKSGIGTLTLSGDNTYSKNTTVSGGTLEVSGSLYSDGTVSASGVITSTIAISAGTLDVTGSGSIGSGAAFDGTITNSGTFNYNSTTDQELSGIISGAGALTKDNSSTLTLSGANTFSGNTTIAAGTLQIGGAGKLQTDATGFYSGDIAIASGAIFQYSSSASNTAARYDGTISGDGTLIKDGSTSILRLQGTTSVANIEINQGTLRVQGNADALGGAGTTVTIGASGSENAILQYAGSNVTYTTKTAIVVGAGSSGTKTILNGGTDNVENTAITLNDSVTIDASGTFTLGGVISGSGGLTKINSGTTTLTGANTYSGNTTVSDGTLSLATGSTHSGTGAYSVEGGILKVAAGVDLSAHAMTIGLGGVISPGNSPGTAITGSQTWNDGGSYLWEINASDIDGGGSIGTDPGWDWLDITGTLDLTSLSAGGFTIDIDSLTSGNIAGDAVGFDTWTKGNPGDVDYSFIIASASGGITDFSADKFSFDSSGFTNGPSWDWQIKLSGTDLVLEAYAVPEPSSTALLGLGGLALMLRRKRS